ncbi:MAG: hypothetical protein R2749_05290 [Acidimicrobiales bacterium]
MAKSLDDARQELDKEYRQFREQWGRVHVAMSDVDRAGPTDDIHALLEKLEDVVKDVRTGGVWGSGTKGHRAARQDWLDAGGG